MCLLDRVDFLELCAENGEIATDVLKASLNLRMMDCGGGRGRCKVNSKHDLVYVPLLAGFGVGSALAGGGSTRSMQGFGSNSGGRYKCVICGTYVD